ncbi:hypothetical protein GCM10023084_37320 [Streptomyces lacrimifluminis]|uniref:Uncharacterized protein n=1 Tax=Streptomyces lacrimifluminis TaxID=1500077 RepID=A0A917L2I3_9ACTN|nr:hypothetical protein GCM10012282_36630 [Streptomyces lacrimifluminis]
MVRPERLQTLHGDLPPQRLVASTPHFPHAATPDQIDQPVPVLDQSGVRHLVLPPPVLFTLPWPVQYGELSSEFVRRGPRAGAEP